MLRFALISLSLFLALNSPTVLPETSFTFPEWIVEQAEQYVDGINALDKTPKNHDYWVKLSLELQEKSRTGQNWRLAQEAKYAAVLAYQAAKNDQEKAIALLSYGATLNPEEAYETPSYLEVYRAANALTNIMELKKKHPSLADLMAFRFISTRVNNQSSPPSACFLFSHPLMTKGVNYADYITVTPKIDANILAHNREICISPLQFGEIYDITFKAGITNEFGEKIKKNQQISLKVRDQDARLSFSNKAYVLIKEQPAFVPLSGVNINTVGLKVLRINDRALNVIISNASRFQKPLWEYAVEDIANFQGELLWEGEMDLSGPKNQTITKQFPFSETVKTIKPGVYIIQAQEKGFLFGEKAAATQWLMISDIGLTVLSSVEEGILISARSLKTAQPLGEIELALISYNNTILKKVKTSNDGIAQFEANLTRGKGGNKPALVLAYSNKGDFSLLDLQQPAFDLSDRGVSGRKSPGPLDAFLYTEQGVYRPGDNIHLNAILRDEKGGAVPNLPLTLKVLRPDEVEIVQHTLKGNELGLYEWVLPVSPFAHMGQWTVLAFSDPKKDAIGKVSFSVEDFVPSRVLVSLKTDQKQLTPKEPVTVSVEGHYLFGSKAAGMDGTASLLLKPNLNPYPQYPGFYFGLVNEPWADIRTPLPLEPLDQQGKQSLTVALDKIPETTRPLEATIKVTLADKGGRPEIGSLKLPVLLSPYLLGIKPEFKDGIVLEEEPTANFEIIAIDEAGKLKEKQGLEYTLYQEEQRFMWFQANNYTAWQYQAITDDRLLTKGTVSTQPKAPTHLKLPLKDWGQYRLEIRDPNTQVASSLRFYKGWRIASEAADTPDYLTIKTDKEYYVPGEKVMLQIEAPFEGQALLTIANQKILQTKNVPVSPQGARVTLTADNHWGSGAYCMVSAFRPLEKKMLEEKSYLPKRAVGIAWLGMDTASRTLNIRLDLPKETQPRQTIEVPIHVETKGTTPLLHPTITIAAVDEGILKLTEFPTPQPQEYFFGKRQLGVELRDLYGKIIQPLPGQIGQLRVGGDVLAMSRNIQALSKRSFKVVSLYKGLTKLDDNGDAKIKLELPDFNGNLRIMAVACDGQRLGSAERNLLVRDPVVLESVLPRFLTPGDKSQLILSLHNTAGQAGQYSVQLKSTAGITLGESFLKIALEKDATYHMVIPIQATQLGDSRISAHLVGPAIDTQHHFDLSIRPSVPYNAQTDGQFLKPTERTKIALQAIQNYVPGTQKIVASWSDKVPWDTEKLSNDLLQYRYHCSEQMVSKGIAALFSNTRDAIEVVNQTLALLSEQQNAEGAFNLWLSTGKGDPWLTAYAIDFFQRASEKGHSVPKFTLERAINWLEKFLERDSKDEPSHLQAAAYGLYVLSKTSKIETGSLRYFQDTYYQKLRDPFSRSLIGAAFVNRGDLKRASQAFSEVFSTAGPSQGAIYPAPYGSPVRDKAGVLLLMMESVLKAPTLKSLNPSIENLRQGLAQELSQQPRLSTNEQAWLILSSQVLNQTAAPIEIFLDGKPYSTRQAPLILELPTTELRKEIVVQNQGKTPVWQHFQLSGIPKKAKVSAEGLSITRNYYTLEGEPLSVQSIQQGTQGVVVLEGKLTSEGQPHQLLIVDLLPAGFEIENAHLNQGQEASTFPWLEGLSSAMYADARDDRFVASLSLKETERTFKLAYIVRAVTPGQYIHPGVLVEDMYSPKHYAQTKESTVHVLPH